MGSLAIKNFRTILDMVPKSTAAAIEAIPDELLGLSEIETIQNAYGNPDNIPIIESMLRRNFWQEYDAALETKSMIQIKRICHGTCSVKHYDEIKQKPAVMAYIIKEPAREAARINSLLDLGWNRMGEIMRARPGVDNKTGLKDTKLSELQLKIWQYTHQRVHGVMTQKHEIKQQTLQVNVDGGKAPQQLTSPQEIDKRLAELETKAQNPQITATAPQALDDSTLLMERDSPATIQDCKEMKRVTSPTQAPLERVMKNQEE